MVDYSFIVTNAVQLQERKRAEDRVESKAYRMYAKSVKIQPRKLENKINRVLRRYGRIHFYEIAARTHCRVEELSRVLVQMELKRSVRRLPGRMFESRFSIKIIHSTTGE